jgi:hypothetical protein
MSKIKNLKIQFNQILDSKIRIGMKRHDAKEVYRSKLEALGEKPHNLKTEYIHSVKTAAVYREVVNKFGKWIKTNYPDVWNAKDISKVTKEVCYAYLKEQQGEGKSAWTISRDMAALNKILDLGLTKIEGDLKKRSLKDIKRSRYGTNTRISKALSKANEDQIIIAKATGMRRSSMTKIKMYDFIFNNNLPVGITLIEKGGKVRIAPILKSYELEVQKILTSKNSKDQIFKYYSKKIDNHSFRAEYASKRYIELRESRKTMGVSINNDFRGYDSSIIAQISKDLGHNRLNIVVEHYLRDTILHG